MAVPNQPVNRPPVVPGAKPRPANPMLRSGQNAGPPAPPMIAPASSAPAPAAPAPAPPPATAPHGQRPANPITPFARGPDAPGQQLTPERTTIREGLKPGTNTDYEQWMDSEGNWHFEGTQDAYDNMQAGIDKYRPGGSGYGGGGGGGAPAPQAPPLALPERQSQAMPDFYDRQAILPQVQGLRDRGTVNPAPGAEGLPDFGQRGEYGDFYDRQNALPDLFQRGDYGDAPQIGGYDDELEQATYQRGLNLLQPGHTDARNDLMRKLANRGISLDSDAYRTAQNRLDTSQGNQRENLALSSVQAARDEAARRFGQEKSLREMLFGEDTTRGGEAARDRAQLFGEETTLGDEAARERAQLFGEDTTRISEAMAQRQLLGDESAREWSQNLAGRSQMSAEDQARAQQALANRGQLFGEDTTRGLEASQRRSQLFGEDTTRYDQTLQGLGLQSQDAASRRQDATQRAQIAAQQQIAQQQLQAQQLAQERQFGFQGQQAQFARQQQGQQFGQTLAEQQAAREQAGDIFGQQLGQQQTQFGQTLAEQEAARLQQQQQFGQQLGQQGTQFDTSTELGRQQLAQQLELAKAGDTTAQRQIAAQMLIAQMGSKDSRYYADQQAKSQRQQDMWGGIGGLLGGLFD